jgi:hypothetical protein
MMIEDLIEKWEHRIAAYEVRAIESHAVGETVQHKIDAIRRCIRDAREMLGAKEAAEARARSRFFYGPSHPFRPLLPTPAEPGNMDYEGP